MYTVLYCRKSRGSQEELQRQIDICLDYCKSKHYHVDKIFSEIASSQNLAREKYCQLQDYIKSNGNTRVVVTHEDRLNRNLVAQITLNQLLLANNSYVEVVGQGVIKLDTPEAKLMSNMLSNFNEYNYNLIKSKMNKGRVKAKENGIFIGKVLYGYRRENKRLTIIPEQAEVVRLIFRYVADGYTTVEVANILNNKGITTNTGSNWTTRSIRNIVKHTGYKGTCNNYVYPQIVDIELWHRANNQLVDHNNRGKKSYNLSGLIKCAKCGNNLVVGFKRDRSFAVVTKGMSKSCKCSSIKYDTLEGIVLSDLLSKAEIILYDLYDQLKTDKKVIEEHEAEIASIQENIKKYKKQLDKVNKLFVLDNITENEMRELSADIKEQLLLNEEKVNKINGYTLMNVVTELQERIVALEDAVYNKDILSLIRLLNVSHIDYWREGVKDFEISIAFKPL